MRRPAPPTTARWAAVPAVLAALAGCGARERVVSTACIEGEGSIVRALEPAPRAVVLEDGTALSRCVSEAVDEAVLQNVGAVFTAAAGRLSRTVAHDPADAVRLGYLVGAVERGAGATAGFQSELRFRMRAFVDDGRLRGEVAEDVRRGRAAGRRAG